MSVFFTENKGHICFFSWLFHSKFLSIFICCFGRLIFYHNTKIEIFEHVVFSSYQDSGKKIFLRNFCIDNIGYAFDGFFVFRRYP